MATLKGKGKGARAAASAAAAGGGGGGANGSSSANAVQGPDDMGLEMYSSTLSRLVEATANTNEVPDDAVIAQVQQDLEALIAQAQHNVAECNARIAKLKRTSALIRDEDAKRQRLDSAGIEDGTGKGEGGARGGDSTTVKNEEGVDTDLTGLQTERRASGDGQTEQYEKNPKSEFVEAQDLPIAALGLFDESVNGLPENGEEYLKKKYAVASYPTKDLKDLLPGDIPDDDFTRAKPPNQVQFTTYAQWLEPYFRPYTEEDISFLKQKGVGLDGDYARAILSPYMIPPLGPLYTQVWAEEDRPNPGYSISPATDATHAGDLKPRGTEADLSGDVLETDSVSCGPLASRLLSALLNEDGPAPASGGDSGGDDDDDDDDSKQNGASADAYKVRAQRADFESLEDRLKREFRYVGILDIGALRREDKRNRQFKLAAPAAGDADGYDIDWVNGTEDDEICFEIRALQKKFRQVSKMNQAYKQRLLPVVQEQMAWQEYSQILEDLDKQVDQAYLRRQRNPKTKKKKNAAAAASTAADKAANDRPGLKALLDKRQRWIEKVGPVFRPSQQMRRTPSESIFKDLHVDEDDDDVDPDDDEDMYTMSL